MRLFLAYGMYKRMYVSMSQAVGDAAMKFYDVLFFLTTNESNVREKLKVDLA